VYEWGKGGANAALIHRCVDRLTSTVLTQVQTCLHWDLDTHFKNLSQHS
jgi:hypothetical protein